MSHTRELVQGIQLELGSQIDLSPSRASELLNEATALLGNCADDLRLADLEYKRILLHCLRTAEKANRAKIEAEVSPQYQAYLMAKDTLKLDEQMIITLRQFLRTKESEMRLSR